MGNAFRAVKRPRRCARRSSPVVHSQQSPACGSKLGNLRPLAKRMEYESVANSNRCLLPADLLTPMTAAETRFLLGAAGVCPNLTYAELIKSSCARREELAFADLCTM